MIAYSTLSLKPKEFWDELSPRDFLTMCKAHNRQFNNNLELRKIDWHLSRTIATLLYNTNCRKGMQISPSELIYIPYLDDHEKKESELPTAKEMEDMKRWGAKKAIKSVKI